MFWWFCPYVGIWILFGYILWVDDMASWGVCYISAVMFYCWNFYACQLIIIWRRDVYFLNIYYNHVIYRFNRNRALHTPERSSPHLVPKLVIVGLWTVNTFLKTIWRTLHKNHHFALSQSLCLLDCGPSIYSLRPKSHPEVAHDPSDGQDALQKAPWTINVSFSRRRLSRPLETSRSLVKDLKPSLLGA